MLFSTQSIPSLISIKYGARRMSFFCETFFLYTFELILWRWMGMGKVEKVRCNTDKAKKRVFGYFPCHYGLIESLGYMFRDLGVFQSENYFFLLDRFRTFVISSFSPFCCWKYFFIGLMDCLKQSWCDPGEIKRFAWKCENFDLINLNTIKL